MVINVASISGKPLSESGVLERTKVARLSDVKKLNLWSSGISDIAIIAEMPNLEVLNISVNYVSCLKPLQNCKLLQELYVRKNNILSFDDLQFLKDLSKLKILWLADNPCAATPDYRNKVLELLPQLERLDNKDVTDDEIVNTNDVRQLSTITDELEASCNLSRSNVSGSDSEEYVPSFTPDGVVEQPSFEEDLCHSHTTNSSCLSTSKLSSQENISSSTNSCALRSRMERSVHIIELLAQDLDLPSLDAVIQMINARRQLLRVPQTPMADIRVNGTCVHDESAQTNFGVNLKESTESKLVTTDGDSYLPKQSVPVTPVNVKKGTANENILTAIDCEDISVEEK